MATVVKTNIDNTSIVLDGASYRDHTFTFAGAATYPAGLLLALNTSTGKIVPYVSGGADGTGTVVSILTYEISATGAGDLAIRYLQAGVVRADYLYTAAAPGTIGITDQVLLGNLQDNNISAVFSDDRSIYDN